MSLTRLLKPRSIAVIGGGAWCKAVIEQNLKLGFDGPIWPVHPTKEDIAGVQVFKSLEELPAPPDATFIGINRNATIEAVSKLSAMSAGGAICFASGFSEVEDGTDLNQQLLDAAGTMPFLGPNCYGTLNALDGIALWPDQHGLQKVDKGVAIVMQSSNILLNVTMQTRGLPIAYAITVGNQAQMGLANVAMELLDDERVSAVGFYIESFDDVPAFEALAKKAAALSKRIAAIKVGTSTAAQEATLSHTASLAGSTAGSDALMQRLNIANVKSLTELIETLKIYHTHGSVKGTNIASLSCSGGEASLMADTADRHGLSFPSLQLQQRKDLSNHLSNLVTLTNPLDYHTQIWRNREAMTAVFSVMAAGDVDLTVIILDFPRQDTCTDDDWQITIDAVKDAARDTERPFAVLASLSENMPEKTARDLIDAGIVPLCGFDDACAAIKASIEPNLTPPLPILEASSLQQDVILDEFTAKQLLADAGLDIPRSIGGLKRDALASSAKEIGFPVVLKGEGIAHKSEENAVALNLMSSEDVEKAALRMQTESFLLEEMVTGTVAELLLGVVRDPAHGFVCTLAAGGVLTELLKDTQSFLIPSTRDEIKSTLQELNVYKLLEGFRGAAPANIDAILTSIENLQSFCIENADELLEIDINPLICTPERAITADALIVKGIPHE